MACKTQKLFGVDGIRGTANVYPMVPELILNVGKAAAQLAHSLHSGKGQPKIVIGKDTRLSGYLVETALTSGIVSQGCTVLLVGPMPTPAVAHLTKSLNCTLGIVLSASHNSAEDNGIKIFDQNGVKLSDKLEHQIEQSVLNGKFPISFTHEKIGKAFRVDDAQGRYIEFVKASIHNKPLTGLKIVLDCANGAAYNIAPYVFSELGVEVIPIHVTPDGVNINKDCGALHPEELQHMVRKHKAHAGIALDGDADRIVMCDEKGHILDGDLLGALIAISLQTKNQLRNSSIACTCMTNSGIESFLQSQGITVYRTPVGDRSILEKIHSENLSFGFEQSGHIILSDYATTGDGIITGLHVLRILKETRKPLSHLIRPMKKIPQILLSFPVKKRKPLDKLKRVQKLIAFTEVQLNGQGRVLVRYSGTENKCRVMIEGPNKKHILLWARALVKLIQSEVNK